MKVVFIFLILLCTNRVFAGSSVCEELTTENFIQELNYLSQEHGKMSLAEIHSDYLSGVMFIQNTFGTESKQYELAMVFISETADMNHEDFEIVEALRIEIIPVLGPENIYKEYRKTLMRKCRDILLAAMILT